MNANVAKILSNNSTKTLNSELTKLAEFINFGDFAKFHGARLRANSKGEVSLLHPRKLPPELLEPPWKNETVIADHVIHDVASHVWSAQIDGHRVRVIDKERQTKPEFVDSMRKQFGSARVGVCVRLWPEANRDG